MSVSPCAGCWAPFDNVTALENDGIVPPRMCPEDQPFVSGGTGSCGCMRPYHRKVCSKARCCRKEYECYGNCGNYEALYIFLGVAGVVGLLILAIVYMKHRNRVRRLKEQQAQEQRETKKPPPTP